MVIGETTRNALKLVNSSLRKSELFQSAVTHLLHKLPLYNKIIQSARCFNPGNRNGKNSCNDFYTMARELIGKAMPREVLPLAVDEWKVYQVENLDEMRETERIDHYWRQIFSIKCQDGSQKFPLMEKIVKAVMLIPHGNSDVER